MPQEGEHPLLVMRGQFLIERAAVDRLAEQFGDFAARIVDRLAQLDRLAVIGRGIVQQRAAIGIDLDLERDAELAAIAEHGLMMAGEPRRPRVPVQALVEFADLAGAVGHVERGAAPDGPVAPADAIADLEHGAVVAGLAELVRRRQAGHSGAENDDLGAVTGAPLERQRLGDGSRAKEAHRLHGEVGGAVAADLRDPAQKFPTGAAHPALVRFAAGRGNGGAIRPPRSFVVSPAIGQPMQNQCRRIVTILSVGRGGGAMAAVD